MESVLINGYVLVSLDVQAGAYRGPDRAPWEVVVDAYYGERLPPALRSSFEAMGSPDLWGPSCQDLGDALAFLDFAHAKGHGVELMAVFSPYLQRVRGVDGWLEPRAVALGFDVMAVGEWSLLRAMGEATRAASDPRWVDVRAMLNGNGLLADPSRAGVVEAKYRELAAARAVEPIADQDARLSVEATAVYGLAMGRA